MASSESEPYSLFATRYSPLSDNVGGKLIFDVRNTVAEEKLALLQALDLQDVGAGEPCSASIAASRSRCSWRSRASCDLSQFLPLESYLLLSRRNPYHGGVRMTTLPQGCQ